MSGLNHRARVDAIARCLAKRDGKFISASDWAGEVGDTYRLEAEVRLMHGPLHDDVRRTLTRFELGYRSGGL